MKAWRKEAEKVNAARSAEIAEYGRTAIPKARVQMQQRRQLQGWLDRGVKSTFLLAGLFIRAGVTPAVNPDGAQV